jgi:hypothetical protein
MNRKKRRKADWTAMESNGTGGGMDNHELKQHEYREEGSTSSRRSISNLSYVCFLRNFIGIGVAYRSTADMSLVPFCCSALAHGLLLRLQKLKSKFYKVKI